MLDNAVIQAAIVAKLKADAALVAWLAARSASAEIREAQWQGTSFVFPAVRVDLGTQNPEGTGPCYPINGEVAFTVDSFGEDDSSKSADQLAGLVNAALFNKTLAGTGFTSGLVKSDGLVGAIRADERLWRATGLYRAYIYGIP